MVGLDVASGGEEWRNGVREAKVVGVVGDELEVRVYGNGVRSRVSTAH